MRLPSWLALGLACFLAASACGGGSDEAPVIDPGDDGNYSATLDADDFVDRIDNPFLPLLPGSRWTYESADGSERIEVVVLEETRSILGITATVVHDVVSEDGEVIEDTYDWYAQDRMGNVWYLGEDSKELEDGQIVSTEGSWEAGVDGAQPGIVMHADPRVGVGYRQEFYEGEAEDLAEVQRLDGTADTPYGALDGLLVIAEWNPLDPDVVEHKYYARGVGVVLEVMTRGGDERVELVSFEPPS